MKDGKYFLLHTSFAGDGWCLSSIVNLVEIKKGIGHVNVQGVPKTFTLSEMTQDNMILSKIDGFDVEYTLREWFKLNQNHKGKEIIYNEKLIDGEKVKKSPLDVFCVIVEPKRDKIYYNILYVGK